MLSIIKALFIPSKDYAGRDIEAVITRLSERTGTDFQSWTYINEVSVYENRLTGMRIYPHELANRAA